MQSKNLTQLIFAVNRFFLIILIILFSLSSCGFKLNRNKVVLPYDARNISLDQIKNNSNNASLHIQLKNMLSSEMMRNNIPLTNPSNADLSLKTVITGSSVIQTEQIITQAGKISTKTYEYIFTINGKVSLRDNREDSEESQIFNSNKVSCSYQVISTNNNIPQQEIDDGYQYCLQKFSKVILLKLTQHF